MADIYINDYGNEINLDKLRYDLAMIYAKRKFNEIDLSLPGMAPDYIEYRWFIEILWWSLSTIMYNGSRHFNSHDRY